ncbi:hypothetical protein WJX74_004677 [Apatococcus lobatus]|uniref:Calponin-homology (CH) domain-containing protein n=1 Tax=Apatococcus lobatus TaxID=904363 RepID=A0AAW1SGB8_9CHLO
MLDLVSLLAGKSISEKVINKVTNKKEAALQQLKNMESMTSFLISHGALLGAIRPALLLDAEDFRQILADKEAAASSHDDHEELQWWFDVEEGFQEQRLSEKAWNAIAAQVVRVMALAQVTWKGLRILPGMENCQIPPEIFTTGSNVYSPGECTLMAWLTAHLQKVFASSAKPSVVANFDIDLSNGLALYAVLVDYWPALLAKGSKLNKAPTTAVHMSENAKAVCNMINQLQLAMSIKVDDILQPNPVNMMIFVLYLFNTLPQLIPKSTVVFSSKLQETQVSCVQLNNSGTRPLIYTARLDGPVDFSLDVHEVRLGPKASQRLPIMCTPPTTKPQAGHLILTSDKGSHLPTSTLVFALQSVLDTRTPLAIFHCAGPLYELAEFDVSVTNPFDLDCDFSLTIVNASSDQLDADLTMPRSHAEDSTQHAHARPSHDLLSQRSTRDHPASSYDGPRVLQDALIRLESHSQRPSNAGDSSADAHYRIFPEAFGTDRGRVRIKGKLEEPVRVSFLPFKLATHKACMILEDSICGKFVIELVAEVSLPKPSTRLSFQMTGEGSQSMEVPVSWPNVQIETARRIFLERHPLARSKLEAAIAKAEGLELPHVLHFRVEHSSSFMQMPNTLVVAKNPTAAAAYGQQHDASLPTVKEHGHREYSRHGPPRKPAGTHPGHPSKASEPLNDEQHETQAAQVALAGEIKHDGTSYPEAGHSQSHDDGFNQDARKHAALNRPAHQRARKREEASSIAQQGGHHSSRPGQAEGGQVEHAGRGRRESHSQAHAQLRPHQELAHGRSGETAELHIDSQQAGQHEQHLQHGRGQSEHRASMPREAARYPGSTSAHSGASHSLHEPGQHPKQADNETQSQASAPSHPATAAAADAHHQHGGHAPSAAPHLPQAPHDKEGQSDRAGVHHPESHRGQGHHRDGHARDHAHGHQKDATVLAKEPVPAPPNMLRVTCNPQEAGTYQVHIVLSSLSDVRVLVVEMVARRALQPLSLVLESPARHKTTQEVPLVNGTKENWLVRAECRGETFTGPREMSVLSGQTGLYSLHFCPPTMGFFAGSIEFAIAAIGEKYVFSVTGRGLEPYAEERISLECTARTSLTRTLLVPTLTPVQSTSYKVLCDLAMLSGQAKLVVPSAGRAGYTMSLQPHTYGDFLGSIVFLTDAGEYCWYMIEVHVKKPPAVAQIQMSAPVRQACVASIPIMNGLDADVSLNIRYGCPYLHGPDCILLQSQASGAVGVCFAPLISGNFATTVSIAHPKLGEYVYDLELSATEADVENIPLMQAELGTIVQKSISIKNPCDFDISINAASSNPHCFILTPSISTILPFGNAEFTLTYRPSRIGDTEEAQLEIDGSQAGSWKYRCMGQGLLPNPSGPIAISTAVGQQTSCSVTWQNPFQFPVKAEIKLVHLDAASLTSKKAECFQLLGRKQSSLVHVAPGATVQIAIGYTASAILESLAELQLMALLEDATASPQSITWRYPLKGQAAITASTESLRFSCPARMQLEELICPKLSKRAGVTGSQSHTYQIVYPQGKHAHLDRCVTLTRIQEGDPRWNPDPDRPLTLLLGFAPRAAFSTGLQLLVSDSGGGQWQIDILLEATQPDVDGMVVLEATPGRRATKFLDLWSPDAVSVPFTARLSADTPAQFDVAPSSGFLPVKPEDESQSPLIVLSFAARDYGRVPNGKLIVATADTQWVFALGVKLPVFLPADRSKPSKR